MRQTFEDYFAEYGRHSYGFSNVLLEPLTPAGQELLISQYGSTGLRGDHSGRQAVANAFCDNFNDPGQMTALFSDLEQARRFITRTTGKSWLWSAARGRRSSRIRSGKRCGRSDMRSENVVELEFGRQCPPNCYS